MTGSLSPRPLARRTFLGGSALATLAVIDLATAPASYPRDLDDVFTLGVASGDPAHDGFVLWTRLAREPLAPDGLGGMPSRRIPVHWEVATDPAMRKVVRRGTAVADPRSAHTVHVEVHGLRPAAEFHYRFRSGKELSGIGRAVTAPLPGSYGRPLRMSFVSCSNYAVGYFTAFRHLAADEPDLVLHLGDYIYETANEDDVRAHAPAGATHTLADYRVRHAQTHTDPDLQAAHAVAPWSVVWDDHDVENNYAGLVPRHPGERHFARRRAAAYQAYYEHLPVRRVSVGPHGARRMYRRIEWGDLATFHMLDTRQYRSDQACGDGVADCPEAADPRRTIMGGRQERWLVDGLTRSRATWNLLGQQVFFGVRDMVPGRQVGYKMDAWDGYKADRQRLLDTFVERQVRNPVILTGDVHKHYANDIAAGPDPNGPAVASELVTTSITSDGDGTDMPSWGEVQLAENPQIKLVNQQRGYVRTVIDRDQMSVDFRVLPFVTRPHAPVWTRASFALSVGTPGLVAT